MSVTVHHGDMLDVLRGMAEASVDSVVTDPPYHLTTGKKGGTGPASLNLNSPAGRSRVTTGFMGKAWDGGDVAMRPETWAEVYRVMKPGAHLVAFGGTRTYHRLACAIEDAGFEIRDQLGWVYGAGFPKSLDVGKAIDKRGGAEIGWFGPWLREERKRRGIGQRDLCERCGFHGAVNHGGAVANWELGLNLPTVDQFNVLCRVLDLPFARLEEVEREVVGRNERPKGWFTAQDGHDITAPATDAARQWAGWGTALKPAWEPIVLARKPLACPTVAAQVLATGTGALNVDGCRVATDESTARTVCGGGTNTEQWRTGRGNLTTGGGAGRWPANLCHDGSPEVLEAFGRFGSKGGGFGKRGRNTFGLINDDGWQPKGIGDTVGHGDEPGNAARFFPALGFGEDEMRFHYSAKASKAERAGSRHPTVKPLALMRWLCRLITPPGGVVLDPFAGSGTTGEAALREGFSAVLIEREAEYVADIERRLARYRDEAPLLAEVAA